MKLEQLVTSKELSEKLRDKGVPQKSLFYWADYGNGGFLLDKKSDAKKYHAIKTYSAFFAGELKRMLTDYGFGDTKYYMDSNNFGKEYVAENTHLTQWGETEAETCGKMLLYLIENGHVKAEELGEERKNV